MATSFALFGLAAAALVIARIRKSFDLMLKLIVAIALGAAVGATYRAITSDKEVLQTSHVYEQMENSRIESTLMANFGEVRYTSVEIPTLVIKHEVHKNFDLISLQHEPLRLVRNTGPPTWNDSS